MEMYWVPLGARDLVNAHTRFLIINRVPPVFVLWDGGLLIL